MYAAYLGTRNSEVIRMLIDAGIGSDVCGLDGKMAGELGSVSLSRPE